MSISEKVADDESKDAAAEEAGGLAPQPSAAPAVASAGSLPKASPPAASPPAAGTPPSGTPPGQLSPSKTSPPQGTPTVGTPPQGTPPQGTPPKGTPPQGTPPKGTPPQGTPPKGTPPQGTPPQGTPPKGTPPQQGSPQPASAHGTPPEAEGDGSVARGSVVRGSTQGSILKEGSPPGATPLVTTPPLGSPPPMGSPTKTTPPDSAPAQTDSVLKGSLKGSIQKDQESIVLQSVVPPRVRAPDEGSILVSIAGDVAKDDKAGRRSVSVPLEKKKSRPSVDSRKRSSVKSMDKRTSVVSIMRESKRSEDTDTLRGRRHTMDGSRVWSTGRKERLSSKSRILGSIISMKRPSGIDYLDRGKISRFMNTFKLEPDRPFQEEKVQKILHEILDTMVQDMRYNTENCIKQAKWAAGQLRAKVKELDYDRYKYICLVTIGEKKSFDIYMSVKFLWDPQRDRYACLFQDNMHVFAAAAVFAIYYE